MKIKVSIISAVLYCLVTSFYPNKSYYKNQMSQALVKININNNYKINELTLSESIYKDLVFEEEVLSYDVFEKAFRGFQNLKFAGKLPGESGLLTVCDFSMSSNRKRLWVIDLIHKKVLFNSLVAHGKGTGEEFATQFSNVENSHQSSLGFYITDETYDGDNGYSLKLHGMDEGYNDAAMQRYIVMHGADYVSEEFIQKEKRLGRSWGCPAVPRPLAKPIIDTIKNKTCLFIYYPDQGYLASSEWLKPRNTATGNMAINTLEDKTTKATN